MNIPNETAPPAGEKTLGQIHYEAGMTRRYGPRTCVYYAWKDAPDDAKNGREAGAAAVVAEYLRRNPAAAVAGGLADALEECHEALRRGRPDEGSRNYDAMMAAETVLAKARPQKAEEDQRCEECGGDWVQCAARRCWHLGNSRAQKGGAES